MLCQVILIQPEMLAPAGLLAGRTSMGPMPAPDSGRSQAGDARGLAELMGSLNLLGQRPSQPQTGLQQAQRGFPLQPNPFPGGGAAASGGFPLGQTPYARAQPAGVLVAVIAPPPDVRAILHEAALSRLEPARAVGVKRHSRLRSPPRPCGQLNPCSLNACGWTGADLVHMGCRRPAHPSAASHQLPPGCPDLLAGQAAPAPAAAAAHAAPAGPAGAAAAAGCWGAAAGCWGAAAADAREAHLCPATCHNPHRLPASSERPVLDPQMLCVRCRITATPCAPAQASYALHHLWTSALACSHVLN